MTTQELEELLAATKKEVEHLRSKISMVAGFARELKRNWFPFCVKKGIVKLLDAIVKQ